MSTSRWFCLLSPLLLSQVSVHAQVQQAWTVTYNSTYPSNPEDSGGPVAFAPSGAVYQAGMAREVVAGQPDRYHLLLTRRDANGVLQWVRTEPVAQPINFVVDLAVLAQDVAVVALGSSDPTLPTPVSHRVVLRYDATGTLVSGYSGGSVGGNGIAQMRIAANGDAILAGSDNDRFVVERIDPTGSLVWSRLPFPAPVINDGASRLTISATGEICAVGYDDSASAGTQAAIARYGPDGTLRWTTELSEPLGSNAFDVAMDDQDRVYVLAGANQQSGAVEQKIVLAYDAQGAARWSQPLPGISGSFASGMMKIDPFGRVVVLADENSTFFGMWMLDASGTVLVHHTGHAGVMPPHAVAEDLAFGASGEILGLVMAEVPAFSGSFERDVLAWDPAGAERWIWQSPYSGFTPSGYSRTPRMAVSGGSILVSETTGAPIDMGLTRLRQTQTIVCTGSTQSGLCPCGNGTNPADQSGCATTLSIGGRLTAQGNSSLSSDTLALLGTSMPDSTVVYLQGSTALGSGMGVAFGDGLRCAGGTIVRIARRTNQSGASSYPVGGESSISTVGGVTAPSTRVYQAWFRNAAPFCTPATFNLTNGVSVEWYP